MMKIDEITAMLDQGLDNLLNGGDWKKYLDTMANFHNYSFRNVILIVMQFPTASRVAGFQTWKKLGRYVKKGETAISIIAPCPHKRKIQDGDEEKEITWNSYRAVPVFDISQTDGEDLPQICKDLTSDVAGYDNILEKLTTFSNVTVEFKDLAGPEKGYFSKKENKIVVRNGMAQAQNIKTLVHEISHSILHSDGKTSDNVQEVEAESIAFVVCRYLGIDTGDYSFGYVAGWSGGDKDLVKGSMDKIQKTAHQIINIFE